MCMWCCVHMSCVFYACMKKRVVREPVGVEDGGRWVDRVIGRVIDEVIGGVICEVMGGVFDEGWWWYFCFVYIQGRKGSARIISVCFFTFVVGRGVLEWYTVRNMIGWYLCINMCNEQYDYMISDH